MKESMRRMMEALEELLIWLPSVKSTKSALVIIGFQRIDF